MSQGKAILTLFAQGSSQRRIVAGLHVSRRHDGRSDKPHWHGHARPHELRQVRRWRPHRADAVRAEPLAASDEKGAEPDAHERERPAGSTHAGADADADDPPDGQERSRRRDRGAEHARLQRRRDESPRRESACGADDTGEAEAFRVSVRYRGQAVKSDSQTA